MTKRKFSKLLNKKAEYTAVKAAKTEEHEGGRRLLTDIRYKGKLYADHIWVRNTEDLNRFDVGVTVGFTATGRMYTDSYGVRKQGLAKCHRYHAISDTYDRGSSENNYTQMAKRKTNRRY